MSDGKMLDGIKEQVEREILKILEADIENNITAMERDYSVSQIAKEVLLSINVNDLRWINRCLFRRKRWNVNVVKRI